MNLKGKNKKRGPQKSYANSKRFLGEKDEQWSERETEPAEVASNAELVRTRAWWKNNSFTKSALIGDKVMHDMKNGLKTEEVKGDENT